MGKYNLGIIGSGPGGYVAAIRASQLGLNVCVIEKDKTGGTCLNRGCIPTKVFVQTANILKYINKTKEFGINIGNCILDFNMISDRKEKIVKRLRNGIEYLLKKNKIDLIHGYAKLLNKNEIEIEKEGLKEKIYCDNIIIATGSVPSKIQNLEIDKKNILTSDEILELKEIPNNLVIIGGGVIGIEFACIFNQFGSKVTIIEMLSEILPLEDIEISQKLTQILVRRGVQIYTSSKFKNIKDRKIIVDTPDGEKEFEFDKLLICTGRKPCLENIGLENVKINFDRYIHVNEKMQTNIDNIYSVGDITGKSLLAYVAYAQGIIASENISGKDIKINYKVIPNCIFSLPEIGSVGLTQKHALEKGYEIIVGKFPFSANSKAIIEDEADGFVKIIIEKNTKEILGIHIIGPHATELIMGPALGLKLEITADEFERIIFGHPTLNESIYEAVENAFGRAIHI